MEQENKFRDRAIAYFKTNTPCHIITEQEDWVNGYIVEEPEEYCFYVLDKVDGKVKVLYVDIAKFEEYIGDKNKLVEVGNETRRKS